MSHNPKRQSFCHECGCFDGHADTCVNNTRPDRHVELWALVRPDNSPIIETLMHPVVAKRRLAEGMDVRRFLLVEIPK